MTSRQNPRERVTDACLLTAEVLVGRKPWHQRDAEALRTESIELFGASIYAGQASAPDDAVFLEWLSEAAAEFACFLRRRAAA